MCSCKVGMECYTIACSFILVYADGGICLDILQNRWSPTYDVSSILTSIQVNLSTVLGKFTVGPSINTPPNRVSCFS